MRRYYTRQQLYKKFNFIFTFYKCIFYKTSFIQDCALFVRVAAVTRKCLVFSTNMLGLQENFFFFLYTKMCCHGETR